jgi:hypothetical protein
MRLLIEEFGPTFMHVKGENIIIADAMSRLDVNFNEKLPTDPTNDSMAYIFLTKTDSLSISDWTQNSNKDV